MPNALCAYNRVRCDEFPSGGRLSPRCRSRRGSPGARSKPNRLRVSAPSAQSTNGRLHHYQVVSGGDINGLTHPDQQRRRAYGSLSIANCSDRIRDRFRPLRNRSRARLTAGVPGTEHLTRHMVTYGAYTGRLIDECGSGRGGRPPLCAGGSTERFRLSRLDLALGMAATVTQSISGASERPEYRVLSISYVV